MIAELCVFGSGYFSSAGLYVLFASWIFAWTSQILPWAISYLAITVALWRLPATCRAVRSSVALVQCNRGWSSLSPHPHGCLPKCHCEIELGELGRPSPGQELGRCLALWYKSSQLVPGPHSLRGNFHRESVSPFFLGCWVYHYSLWSDRLRKVG